MPSAVANVVKKINFVNGDKKFLLHDKPKADEVSD